MGLAEAQRALAVARSLEERTKKVWVRMFGGQSELFEHAASACRRAGAYFKMAGAWTDAANAQVAAGTHALRADKTDAKTAYKDFADAAHCAVMAAEFVDAAHILEAHALPSAEATHNLLWIARTHAALASALEKDDNAALAWTPLLTQALRHYQVAADLYAAESATSDALGAVVHVARLHCRRGLAMGHGPSHGPGHGLGVRTDTGLAATKETETGAETDTGEDTSASACLKAACTAFERAACMCLESRMLAHAAKQHALDALLCILADGGDCVAAAAALRRFTETDYAFAGSREGGFAADLVQATADADADKLVEACAAFDSVSPLSPWRTAMLVELKRGLQRQWVLET